MSDHRAQISWKNSDREFSYEGYGRDHDWHFEGANSVAASSAPEFFGNPHCVDPEQALVAAVASCHMLTFLAIAAKKRLKVVEYTDDAVGHLEKNTEGRLAITRVELRPQIVFEGDCPEANALERMHDKAHSACFIANSISSTVTVTGSATAVPNPS